MGHKTHPIGFRLGITKEWQARWYADNSKEFSALLLEDIKIREAILSKYHDAGISRVEIERSPHEVVVNIHTARPGIVIGRGGQRVEELRKFLEQLTQKRARLNIQEIRQPELDAFLVARSVADQLERRIAFRRAIRQSVSRTTQAGAKGIKVLCSGRLGGAEIARKEKAMQGRVPLHTLRADIDFAIAEAHTTMGRIGVKVWIYKGEIVPRLKEAEAEEMAPIEVTLKSEEEGPEAKLAETTAIGQALAPVLSEEVKEGTPQVVTGPSAEEAPQKVIAAEGAKKRPTRRTTKQAVDKTAKEQPAEGKAKRRSATAEKEGAVEIAEKAPVELEAGKKRSRKKTVVKEGVQDATAQKGEVPKGSSRKTKGQSPER